jgi:hypothetical protein
MKLIFNILILFTFSISAYTQDEWDSWNNNYRERNVTDLIKFEKLYADSVDQGLIIGKYYLRMDNYRFSAQFTGKKRDIPDSIKSSMRRVYKVYGNPDYLPIIDALKYEYQFQIDGNTYWISMQSILDKSFKKEVKKDDFVYLYCLFLNEHGLSGELYNTFLISEFRK